MLSTNLGRSDRVPNVLSEAEAAERLGVSKGTLANWRWRKYGPAFLKVGGRVEYVEEDVEEWRLAQRRDPSEETPPWKVRTG
jgi:hypothetical protein